MDICPVCYGTGNWQGSPCSMCFGEGQWDGRVKLVDDLPPEPFSPWLLTACWLVSMAIFLGLIYGSYLLLDWIFG